MWQSPEQFGATVGDAYGLTFPALAIMLAGICLLTYHLFKK